MVDVVAHMFACRGVRVSQHTMLFQGTSGLRALSASVPVTAPAPAEAMLTMTRHRFRDSALTLVQNLGSPVTIHIRRAADPPAVVPARAQDTNDSDTVHCILSGDTGADGSYDPATMAVTWFFDAASEFDWTVSEGQASLVMSVPVEAIADYPDDRATSLPIYQPRCTIAPAIAGFGLALVNDAGTSAAVRTPVADYAIDRFLQEMAGIVLVENRGVTSVQRGPRRELYFQATALITELYSDPELGPAELASALNVSIRTVQQAFQEAGSSASAEIRAQRARAARHLLTEPKYDVLSISQIARHCGYRSESALREGLKSRYGVTPRELRSGRGGAGAQVSPEPRAQSM
ncbi:AraC-type DNA-binding protein [Propionibacterium cyclohexanicum]|uniref:AraC-type DNA-binding protein n=1 Tax=Propionibacterium cyclohexanicum TaxID=64702 RepID=A0A1H9TXW8_9ACTN|nr:AraC family transcriptional regulator [Propionibacterium cyclohexanicum]SES01861.1 AraC-type DNA-binding protein [Propionibacterium cyclohexanicum]